MALRDEIREQRRSLKGKGKKAYLEWFLDYNLWPVLGIAFAAVIVIYIVVTVVSDKESVFGVMFVNASVADGQAQALEEDFMDYAGIDAQRYEIYADLDETYVSDGTDLSSAYYSAQAVFSRLAAGQIDVMAADPTVFGLYAESGYFLDLTQVLDEETLASFDGMLYYIERSVLEQEETQTGEGSSASEESIAIDEYVLPDPEQMEDPVPVGILANSAVYLQENHNYDYYVCLLGVVSSTENYEYCRLFIDYLFGGQQSGGTDGG